jgi:twinkle protein
MNIKEISNIANQNIEQLVHQIAPNAKIDGNYYVLGSSAGEAGKSLKLNRVGTHKGKWTDFATGETGDLIDLYSSVSGSSLRDSVEFIARQLGIEITPPAMINGAIPKPEPIAIRNNGFLTVDCVQSQWLRSRGITDDVIKKYHLLGSEHNGEAYVIFPTYDEEQQPVFAKMRSIVNKKNMFTKGKGVKKLFGLSLYTNVREIIITEGEIDALSFAVAGFNAVSVPYGAGNGGKNDWIEQDYESLEMFDTIYVSMDMDDSGAEALNDIVNRIGQERVKVIKFEDGIKDANEALLAGVDLRDVVSKADYIKHDQILTANELREDLHELFAPEKQKTGEYFLFDDKDRYRFQMGELTIVAGVNGHGKSQLMGYYALGFLQQGAKVGIASFEMPPRKTLKRMVRQICHETHEPTKEYIDQAIDFMHDNGLFIYDRVGTVPIDDTLKAFKYLIKRHGVTHFFIDSLSKLGVFSDDYNGQKAVVDKLFDFAKKYNVHVHLVHHIRKLADDTAHPTGADILGSGDITNVADNVFLVWRNKKLGEVRFKQYSNQSLTNDELQLLEDLKDFGDCYIHVYKTRDAEFEGKIWLKYDFRTMQYLPLTTNQRHKFI